MNNNNGIQITEDQRAEINKLKVLNIDLDNAVYFIENAKDKEEITKWLDHARRLVRLSPFNK